MAYSTQSNDTQTGVSADDSSDGGWLLSIQRKLYHWSSSNPQACYRDLWNWTTDLRNLRCAWQAIAANRGARTAGVDGQTVKGIAARVGRDAFLNALRDQLREATYRPSPCRRRWIPKPGKPGQFRPLGIPTVADRVVQAALKNLLEPIFEATFWHVSYGFRPGRGCHGALEHIRMAIRPRRRANDGLRRQAPYQWAIEGDIKGCFDHISHHQLMERIRARVGDLKITRLVGQLLQAGVLEEGFLLPTQEGTPQGGVISPLLANIALTVIEERYERWVHHRRKLRARRARDGITAAEGCRRTDRRRGVPVFYPIRYADDFVILVSGTREEAETEKRALAHYLHVQMGLELSAEKTRVTDLTRGFEFLGHRVRLKWHPRFGLTPRIEIPKPRQADLRHRLKTETQRHSLHRSLADQLERVNAIVRGWGHYYRFCTGASDIFSSIDHYVDDRLWRWVMKKHRAARRVHPKRLVQRGGPYGGRQLWSEAGTEQFLLSSLRVERFRRGWMSAPAFARDLPHLPESVLEPFTPEASGSA